MYHGEILMNIFSCTFSVHVIIFRLSTFDLSTFDSLLEEKKF